MGTPCLTVFLTQFKGEICVMYRQFDGYPDGHGKELAEFLKDITIVNGIPVGDTRKLANGMGCLAAQVIDHFKDGVGGIYIESGGTRNTGEDYVYYIMGRENSTPIIKICEVHGGYDDVPLEEKEIFLGYGNEVLQWVEEKYGKV